MIILVNGILPYNAGKTSLIRALLLWAQREGERFTYIKPRSAHNYWEHYDHTRTCQSLGKLVSRDALLLRELCADAPPIEVVNPYHQLMCPLDFSKVQEPANPLVQSTDLILAERLTSPEGKSALFLNERPDIFVADRGFLEALKRGVDKVETFQVSPLAEGKAAVDDCVRSVFESIRARWPHIVIESVSDVPFPFEFRNDDADLVVSVGGSVVSLLDPAQIMNAMDVVRGETLTGLMRYLRPLATLRIPHLTSKERAEEGTLSQAYAQVVRAVVERME